MATGSFAVVVYDNDPDQLPLAVAGNLDFFAGGNRGFPDADHHQFDRFVILFSGVADDPEVDRPGEVFTVGIGGPGQYCLLEVEVPVGAGILPPPHFGVVRLVKLDP